MRHFEPTLGIKDTSRNVQSFVKEHHSAFIDLLKSIAPYLFICLLLSYATIYLGTDELAKKFQDYAVQQQEQAQELKDARGAELSDEEKRAQLDNFVSDIMVLAVKSPVVWGTLLIQLFMGYLYATIAISWHRLVLLGPAQYQPMEIFRPQRHEIEFIAVLTLINVIFPIVGWYIGFKLGMSMDPAFVFLGMGVILFMSYLFYKICFFFPAKAVNAQMSFARSFHLTFGYFWKMIFSYIRAALKIVAIIIVYSIVAGITMVTLLSLLGVPLEGSNSVKTISDMIVNLPIIFYFQPLLMIYGVTILSNYYQHALQNKGVA